MRSKIYQQFVILARLTALAVVWAAGYSSFGQSIELVLGEGLREPSGVAVDPQNNYYVVDSANDRIVRINPETGVIAVLAGGTDIEGFVDERGQRARFRNPQSIVAMPLGNSGVRLPGGAVATTGFLVSDAGNHSIRHVGLDGLVSTILGVGQPGSIEQRRLNAPVGLAVSSDGWLYIADAQNNAIRRLHLLTGDLQNVLSVGLLQPQGLAFDEGGALYIADTGNHVIKRIVPGGDAEIFAGVEGQNGFVNAPFFADSRFDRPAGLVWGGSRNGLLVADSGNGVVRRLYDLNTGQPRIETFGNTANNPLLTPVALARELGGAVLVADPGRNALYAIRTSQTPQPPVPPPVIGYVIFTNLFECNGTFLVAVTNATFNNDVTIAIRGDAQSQTFFIAGPTDQVQDLPPTETPLPYADCQPSLPPSLINPGPDITIKAYSTQADRRPSPMVVARFRFKTGNPIVQGNNPASLTLASATAGAQIYYTFGTTANPPADPTQANGQIYQPGTSINLNVRSEAVILRARAFKGSYAASDIVEKTFEPEAVEYTPLGFQRNFIGGPGATVIVPVHIAPVSATEVRSYQFRAEVRPTGDVAALHNSGAGGAPRVAISLLPGNDFIPFSYGSQSNEAFLYETETSDGIVVAALGNPEGPAITNATTVAVLGITIPTNAHPGQRYELSIREVSATSDGNQRAVAITNLPPVSLTVRETGFLVGDVASANWYNAGEFGDGELRNNDVNAAFLAALGMRVPYTVSDAFKAMDVYPPDTAFRRGGDNQIRFLDWQTLLVRSVGLDTNNWVRRYTQAGVEQIRTNVSTIDGRAQSGGLQAFAFNALGLGERVVWSRPARLGALRVSGVGAGTVARVPVYLQAKPGIEVSGLQFIARIEPVGQAPAVAGPISFEAAAGFAPTSTGSSLPGGIELESSVYASWNVGALRASGSNLIGHINFPIPSSAAGGATAPASYTVLFEQTDGAIGSSVAVAEQLDFESVRNWVYVGAQAVGGEHSLATEWVDHFFGGQWPGTLSDPDGDGLPNWLEFNEGTHPLENDSALEIASGAGQAQSGELTLRWFGARHVRYTLETTANLNETWTPIAPTITGEGRIHTYPYSQPPTRRQFFRMRVNP